MSSRQSVAIPSPFRRVAVQNLRLCGHWAGGLRILIAPFAVPTRRCYPKRTCYYDCHQEHIRGKLPGRFSDLVALMPPHTIRDETDYDNVIEMLDRLTSVPKMTKGQELYLGTVSILAVTRPNTTRLTRQTSVRWTLLEFLMAENERVRSGPAVGQRIAGLKDTAS